MHGVTRSALRGSQWRHLFRDVWVHKDLVDSRALRLQAVKLILGADAFVCGLTAAWIYGIDVQDSRGDLVWIGCLAGHRPRARPGCLVRQVTVDVVDLQEIDGVLITTELRTAFDCARWLTVVEGVVFADHLAHLGRVSPNSSAPMQSPIEVFEGCAALMRWSTSSSRSLSRRWRRGSDC
jgi:hypothetical protein